MHIGVIEHSAIHIDRQAALIFLEVNRSPDFYLQQFTLSSYSQIKVSYIRFIIYSKPIHELIVIDSLRLLIFFAFLLTIRAKLLNLKQANLMIIVYNGRELIQCLPRKLHKLKDYNQHVICFMCSV